MNTFFLVDKPVGWTSFDVCNRLKRLTAQKRIGHTGTLDPFATGLLVVATGKCTKLIPFLEKDKKTYEAEIWLGGTSETLDPESEICYEAKPTGLTLTTVQQAIDAFFIGIIEQIPPKYSALKINGKRAYDLARAGQEIEMKVRSTEVTRAQVLSLEESSQLIKVRVELTVAAGFYVRSFARDLAEKLGTVGLCGQLRRTGVGNLQINQVSTLITEKYLKNHKTDVLPFEVSPEKIFNWTRLEISVDRLNDWQQGRALMHFSKLSHDQIVTERCFVFCGGRLLGVESVIDDRLQPRVVF